MKKAFTLIELLVVVAIMGLLGTVAVGGYQAMQRGMEQKGVMRNVNEFIRAAYQRAEIDRQPVAVLFWNETLQTESEDDGSPLIVVGKAVAVRRSSRISAVVGSVLVDEFSLVGDDDSVEDTSSAGSSSDNNSFYLYNMTSKSDAGKRCRVAGDMVRVELNDRLILSSQQMDNFYVYGYKAIGGADDFGVGTAYGFEFAEIQLPHNYIFKSGNGAFSTNLANPIMPSGNPWSCWFERDPNGNMSDSTFTIEISNIRPGQDGKPTAQPVGPTSVPSKMQDK